MVENALSAIMCGMSAKDTYMQWLIDGLKKPGKSAQGLAKRLARNPSVVTRMTTGIREIKAVELPIISAYIEEPLPHVDPVPLFQAKLAEHYPSPDVPVVGEVAAGAWHEVFDAVDMVDRDNLPVSSIPADRRFPAGAQFDLIVRGTSLNKYAADGDYLRCVDVIAGGVDIQDGDLVIVERRRDDGHLMETTAKRIRITENQAALLPESNDPRWQTEIPLSDSGSAEFNEVRVRALVLFKYAPARR